MQERLVDTNKILKITFKFSVPGYLSKIKGIFTFYKSSFVEIELQDASDLTCLFETSSLVCLRRPSLAVSFPRGGG